MTTENPGTRGRPRSFDMDEAIDKAARLFHARGYDAVGVAEIGAELGIKPPSFYAAFGSKAGLFARALERYAASDANIFTRALQGGGDVDAVIERMLHVAAQIYPERGGVAGCLVQDGARNSADPDACALTAAAKTASRTAIRDFIATQYPARADQLTDLVTIATAGMSAAARDGADETRLTAFAGTVYRAFRQEAAETDSP